MIIDVGWEPLKALIIDGAPYRWVEANGAYRIYAFDDPFCMSCTLPVDGENSGKVEFETYYKNAAKKKFVKSIESQFERTDLDLKIAKIKQPIVNGSATLRILAPGDFGSGVSRFAGGGYCMLDSFDPDDMITIRVEDHDRNIGWMIAMAQDPNATEPASDEMIRAMGEIPGIGMAFPDYPTMRSYTDDEQPEGMRGWYFWPLALGNNQPAYGEVEIDPLGFYGEIPAGLYVTLEVKRPNVSGGTIRACIYWGKSAA